MTTKQLLGRTQRARRNLALKLVLERRFFPEISAYFNAIVRSFRAVYVATGSVIVPESFENDTRSLLKKQYIRTSKAFSNEMRLAQEIPKSLPEAKQEELTQQESEAVDAALLLFINRITPERSQLIDQTNVTDMNDSIREAVNQLVQENRPLTDAAVGALAAVILKRKFDGRRTTIAMTETQFMAESTKAIEAAVVSSEGRINVGDILPAIGIAALAGNKSWASILDGNTRTGQFDHVQADGQRVPMSQPFIVSGESLMFPSDRSLGASAGNTINCRCSSLYSLGQI